MTVAYVPGRGWVVRDAQGNEVAGPFVTRTEAAAALAAQPGENLLPPPSTLLPGPTPKSRPPGAGQADPRQWLQPLPDGSGRYVDPTTLEIWDESTGTLQPTGERARASALDGAPAGAAGPSLAAGRTLTTIMGADGLEHRVLLDENTGQIVADLGPTEAPAAQQITPTQVNGVWGAWVPDQTQPAGVRFEPIPGVPTGDAAGQFLGQVDGAFAFRQPDGTVQYAPIPPEFREATAGSALELVQQMMAADIQKPFDQRRTAAALQLEIERRFGPQEIQAPEFLPEGARVPEGAILSRPGAFGQLPLGASPGAGPFGAFDILGLPTTSRRGAKFALSGMTPIGGGLSPLGEVLTQMRMAEAARAMPGLGGGLGRFARGETPVTPQGPVETPAVVEAARIRAGRGLPPLAAPGAPFVETPATIAAPRPVQQPEAFWNPVTGRYETRLRRRLPAPALPTPQGALAALGGGAPL